MSLKSCAHCRCLFESTRDTCPACGRPASTAADKPPERVREDRPTIRRPAVKLPPKS